MLLDDAKCIRFVTHVATSCFSRANRSRACFTIGALAGEFVNIKKLKKVIAVNRPVLKMPWVTQYTLHFLW